MLLSISCNSPDKPKQLSQLQISENARFFATETGDPFFWLADTGWLLFTKLTCEEAEKYFDDRSLKGFNVIQPFSPPGEKADGNDWVLVLDYVL